MVKKPQIEAQTKTDGAPVLPAQEETSGPVWPVESADKLTLAHVPQKLRDEITRPYLRDAQVVANVAQVAMELRNDLLNGLARLEKEGNKDSSLLNARLQTGEFQVAASRLGLHTKEEAPRGRRGGDAHGA